MKVLIKLALMTLTMASTAFAGGPVAVDSCKRPEYGRNIKRFYVSYQVVADQLGVTPLELYGEEKFRQTSYGRGTEEEIQYAIKNYLPKWDAAEIDLNELRCNSQDHYALIYYFKKEHFEHTTAILRSDELPFRLQDGILEANDARLRVNYRFGSETIEVRDDVLGYTATFKTFGTP